MTQSFLDKSVSMLVNLVFSKEKTTERMLVLLMIIGFILRLIAALNLAAFPDDMVHGSQSAGVLSAKILSTHSTPPLFFYLNDLSFHIFGYSTFALRLFPLIFGTFLIPLIFLLTKKFFDKNIALAAAFFVTFSNLLIRMTISEQSLQVLFLSFFGVYLGLEYLEKKSIKFIILSAIIFGIATLTKYNAPFFILCFLIYSVYYFKSNNEKVWNSKNVKILVIFLAIIFIFALPFLTFNYLLFKEKGIVDVYFSRVIKLDSTQQLYGSLAGQDLTFFDLVLNYKYYGNVFLPYHENLLMLLFALLGIFFIFKNNRKFLIFLSIFIIIPFFLQTGGSTLTKHFVFLPFLLAMPSGVALVKIFEKINKKTLKIIILAVISIIFIINLGNQYGTPASYFYKSDVSQVKSFITGNVKEQDLIIFDTRIYTAQTFWFATPNHFLNFHSFAEIYNLQLNQTETSKAPTKVYIVECALDNCGWGNDQDLNKSSETLLDQYKQNSKLIKSIESYDYNSNEILGKKEKTEKYRIYSSEINLDPNLVKYTDYLNTFYFAPYMYKNMKDYLFNFDNSSSLDNLLEKIAYYIIILSMIISIISIILLIYLVLK